MVLIKAAFFVTMCLQQVHLPCAILMKRLVCAFVEPLEGSGTTFDTIVLSYISHTSEADSSTRVGLTLEEVNMDSGLQGQRMNASRTTDAHQQESALFKPSNRPAISLQQAATVAKH